MNLFELLLHLAVFLGVGIAAAYLAILPSFVPTISKRRQDPSVLESEEVETQ
jgi:hypothetical protein